MECKDRLNFLHKPQIIMVGARFEDSLYFDEKKGDYYGL